MTSLMPLTHQIDKFAKALHLTFPQGFSLDQTEVMMIGKESTPVLRHGNDVLNMNFRMVDDFSSLRKVSATIFVQRGNDFVRIATSVKKENGERAVGTILDHSHAGYKNLLAGRTYIGFAQLFGRLYMTRYDPVRDGQGRVVAVLYVGIDVSERFQLGISGQISGIACTISAVIFAAYIWSCSLAVGALPQPSGSDIAALILRYGMLAFVVLLLGMGLFHAWLNNKLAKPLVGATQAAQKLAKGDLTTMVHVGRRDELGGLLQAINGVAQGLTGIVSSVRTSSQHINTASQEIAMGNNDLSSRAESQASALEQVSAAILSFNENISNNANHTHEAESLVERASVQASEGAQVVSSVVSTMSKIRASSHKVADIISVIDGIAFQTNILALNAAVEAARAGEQGRGFAVVATEVRQLAQRSAAAAQEVRHLIEESVSNVDSGDVLVNRAGTTMQNIDTAIGSVAAIMREIAAAGTSQREDIAEVTQAISDIDQATQQNAALVEQAAAATDSLYAEAGKLLENVSIFKLA